jgi:hypothetical protein
MSDVKQFSTNLVPTKLTIPMTTTLVKATQTLTSTGTNPANGGNLVIDTVTYVLKTTITVGVAAAQTLTSDNTNVAVGDKVVVNTTTYEFIDAIPEDEYQTKNYILIGANADASLLNLKNAINDAADGYGTTRSKNVRIHPQVSAGTISAHAFTVTAKVTGAAANAYPTTETSAHLSWGTTTMASGVDTVANEIKIGVDAATTLDNIKAAINASGTPGTEYSIGTVIHPTVTATTNAATTQVVEAKTGGAAGNSIATTKTITNTSWGAATLAGGGATVGQVAVGDGGVIRSIVSVAPDFAGTPTYTLAVKSAAGHTLYVTGSLAENTTVITAKEMMLAPDDLIVITASGTVEDTLSMIVYLR